MANPGTTLSLTSTAAPAAVQSIANRIHCVGPGSKGPLNTPTAINKLSDLALFGFGPGCSLAGEVYAEAISNLRETGLPVFFTRSATSTPSALGTLTKSPKSAGTALAVYGQVRLAGADENGDLFWQAKQAGVTLTVQSGMSMAHSIASKAITLTIPAATAASAVVTYWNAQAALVALADIDAFGTGASNAGTTLATVSFDNGTLTFTPLDNGYSVEILVSGTSTSLSHSFGGTGNRTLTIHLATDSDGEPTSTAAAVITQLGTDIAGKLTAVAGGTGLGLAGAKAVTALTFGSTAAVTTSGTPTDRYLLQVRAERGGALGSCTIKFAVDEPNPEARTRFGVGGAYYFWILAKRTGLSVEFVQQTGTSKALTHTFVEGLLSIKLGTDSSDLPSTSASALRSYLAGFPQLVAAFRFGVESGDGTDILPAADTVVLANPALNWSGELLVPGSGIVHVKNSTLDTGVVMTFTGTLEAGDLWVGDSTLPVSSAADQLAALNAIKADAVNLGAVVAFASSLDRSGGSLYDASIQAALQTRQLLGFFAARGIGEGVSNETHDAWKLALTVDWLGFVSVRGLLSKVGGEYVHIDPYTGRNMRRYLLFAVAGRKAAAPYHQDLGRVLEVAGSGSIKRCLGLYHDEESSPGLHDQGFITATSAVERPGAKFITASPTCADQADSGYALVEYPATILVGLRIAKLRAFDLRNTTFATTSEADSTGAPVGALTPAAAESMEQYLGQAVQEEYERRKSDGEPSTSPLGEGEKYVEVLRTNKFANDRTIYFRVNCRVKTPAQFISIEGNVVLGQ